MTSFKVINNVYLKNTSMVMMPQYYDLPGPGEISYFDLEGLGDLQGLLLSFPAFISCCDEHRFPESCSKELAEWLKVIGA